MFVYICLVSFRFVSFRFVSFRSCRNVTLWYFLFRSFPAAALLGGVGGVGCVRAGGCGWVQGWVLLVGCGGGCGWVGADRWGWRGLCEARVIKAEYGFSLSLLLIAFLSTSCTHILIVCVLCTTFPTHGVSIIPL